jgi:Head domain of trimeric autotransporter adhesin
MVFGSSNTMTTAAGSLGALISGTGNSVSSINATTASVNSVALGSANVITAPSAWLIGKGLNAPSYLDETVIVGTYNNPSMSIGASFVVGNGTSAVPSTAFRVMKNGSAWVAGSVTSTGLVTTTLSASTSATVAGSPVVTQATLGAQLSAVANSSIIRKTANATTLGSTSIVAWGSGASATWNGDVAIGNNAVASSNVGNSYGGNIAIGVGSLARGTYNSVAIGGGQTGIDEEGREAVAIGFLAKTTGAGGLAIGYGTESAEFATSVGINAKAKGWAATSLGYVSSALGEKGTAVGFYSSANFLNSSAFGAYSKATIAGASALGTYSEAGGAYSTAVGAFTKSQAVYSNALGRYNLATGDAWNWIETDSLFELGNGTADGNNTPASVVRSNAITTLKNGQTTLTNKAWKAATVVGAPAFVSSAANSNGAALVVEGNTELKGSVTITNVQGDISMGDFQ